MDVEVRILSNPTVALRLTSTLSSFEVHRKFNRGISIAELKSKLEMIVGTPASSMDLELFSIADTFLQKLDDNEALLGSYHVDDDCRLHVTDRSGAQKGEFTDVSRVEKYEISDDAYARRKDSARSFLQSRKAKVRPFFNEGEIVKKQAEEKEKVAAGNIATGDRCQVQIPGQPDKIGTVMYVGTTDFKPGYWVGVRYDEPLGKNDGSVNGKRYFECQNSYGSFVKPLNVTVGAFAQEDYDDLDEM